jgi:endonuclease-8
VTRFRAARALHRALAGRQIVRFESTFPALTRVHDDHSLQGRTVEKVESRGKNLLMMLSGGLDARLTYWCPSCQKETDKRSTR